MKLCVIYNTAPKYRERIFKLIDEYYDCDWYFGHTKTDIKEMDTSLLKRVNYYKSIGNTKMSWQCGVIRLLFKKDYNTFLITAESRSLTLYLFLFILQFLRNKKVYIWTHGLYGKENYIEKKLKLWSYYHANGLFLYGNYSKQLLIEQGFPERKMFVIHNSLFYDRQMKIRESIHLSDIYAQHFGNNNPVLIFIGRLTQVKRLDMIVDAVALLKEKGQSYNIVYVGDGVMRTNLELLVAKKSLTNNVWFYGASYDERINAELIYNADLCVAPGNVGLTAMHTMVYGCPVITHNDFKWQMPECEAIKEGITGAFFQRGDVESLADAIGKWFSIMKDKRDVVRQACFKEIDNAWTPHYQMNVLSKNLNLNNEHHS